MKYIIVTDVDKFKPVCKELIKKRIAVYQILEMMCTVSAHMNDTEVDEVKLIDGVISVEPKI